MPLKTRRESENIAKSWSREERCPKSKQKMCQRWDGALHGMPQTPSLATRIMQCAMKQTWQCTSPKYRDQSGGHELHNRIVSTMFMKHLVRPASVFHYLFRSTRDTREDGFECFAK